MKQDFLDEVLKTRPKLTGSHLRIIMCLLYKGSGVVPATIIEETGISKSHVSEDCTYLFELGILRRYAKTMCGLRRVKYSVNLDYKAVVN